jgi:hypothetical protein
MRKGQSAGDIAVFIFLIAVFVVIYVLMVPPSTREELLGINSTTAVFDDNASILTQNSNGLLLSEVPGIVKPFDKGMSSHEMDDVAIYIKNEPKTTDLAAQLEVSNSLFGDKSQELSFTAEQLKDLKNVVVYVNVQEGQGSFSVQLNGKEIYDNVLDLGIETIMLPINMLGEYNTIKFNVDKRIFGKNYYILKDIKVRQVYELQNTYEDRTFILNDNENGNGVLRYNIYCNAADKGSALTISLNEETLAKEIIPCAATIKSVEVDKNDLQLGKNTFRFQIDKGDFLFSNVRFEVDSEEGGALKYEFPITKSEYESILAEQKDVKLEMQLGDDGKATIDINGNLLNLDGDTYSRYISRFVEKGTNTIKIIPKNEFEIQKLEISLENA